MFQVDNLIMEGIPEKRKQIIFHNMGDIKKLFLVSDWSSKLKCKLKGFLKSKNSISNVPKVRQNGAPLKFENTQLHVTLIIID